MWKQNQNETKKNNPTNNSNREILFATYIFVGLFLLLSIHFIYFLLVKSEDVINNSYNKRQDLLAERIIRGKILGNKGEVLAETIEENGESMRVYPYKNMFAHVVGRFQKGKTGIESTENFRMLTSNRNPVIKMMKELSGEKNPGDNIITTLDVTLQKAAYDALGNKKGAVVVIEPETGKILAMVSKPDFDPNTIEKDWEYLSKDEEKNSTFINRATQEWYPPGSTFKILTALEYIRERPKKHKNYEYTCSGADIFEGVKINCYHNRKHGEIDLKQAFAKSCNTSFSNIGMKLDVEKWKELCNSFLFNRELPINLPYVKSKFILTKESNKDQIPQTAIGQGDTLITPFHNALIVSAIANEGVLMTPYLVDHIETDSGDIVKKFLPSVFHTMLTAKEADILTDFMKEAVKSGTASALNHPSYQAAGKTGSAEYAMDKPAHAWFVGFGEQDKKKIAVSVIVESVGTGSEYAVPIAKKILDAYFLY